MKQYPSLNYYGDHWGVPGIAFDKLDGSNLRLEWSKKRGFYKFGTRNVLIDQNTPVFGKAIPIFLDKYNDSLENIFRSKDYRDAQNIVCFAEFLGVGSSYGQHAEDDTHDMVLFDVSVYKKGFVKPRTFLKDFGHLHIPEVIYDGPLNQEFVEAIKTGKYPVKEGVIFKAVVPTKKGADNLYYCKVKTNAWLDGLRMRGGDAAIMEELRKK